ncbi:dephospho-CoA kinase [Rhizobium paknamense]|uniref:Dephospho-CoA kinase n=1 Tax=Rhizobium paknamense TaxID=1206817 RepID=A0ABU0II88_9HYPH|nr:dephospho-CoA kinase [Rhizobium paknamense]MDQ0457949.1 dephospho-CoA kinase [Rhizobium paknamense]
MITLGLTGSIGMGKSTTARMFAEQGVPVHDADATVHDLYRKEAVVPVGALFPEAVVGGVIDRQVLSSRLAKDPDALKALEAVVHPLVRARETAFLKTCEERGTPLVLLDIPLLYESGGEKRLDKVAVVTCSPEQQRQRVLARPGWTEEKLAMVLARQMPDAEKRARADFIIDTGQGLEYAREQVRGVIARLLKEPD